MGHPKRTGAAIAALMLAMAGGATAADAQGVESARPPDAAAPAAAAPAPLPRGPFETFQALCLAHGGRAADALRDAEAAGWTPVAPADLPKFPVGLVSAEGRTRPPAQGVAVLAAGRARYTYETTEIDFALCGLFVEPSDSRDLSTGLTAWAGLEPADTYPDGSRVYLFLQDGQSHHPVPDVEADGAIARASRTGQLWIVVAAQNPRGGFVAAGPVDRMAAPPPPPGTRRKPK